MWPLIVGHVAGYLGPSHGSPRQEIPSAVHRPAARKPRNRPEVGRIPAAFDVLLRTARRAQAHPQQHRRPLHHHVRLPAAAAVRVAVAPAPPSRRGRRPRPRVPVRRRRSVRGHPLPGAGRPSRALRPRENRVHRYQRVPAGPMHRLPPAGRLRLQGEAGL